MKKSVRGFTLVELLIVIAIIAILAVIVSVVINPIEIMKQGRDADRMSALATVQQAINVAAQEATLSGTEILCFGGICTGDSITDGRSAKGDGWVKVNLVGQSTVTMPTLPTDPINAGDLKYAYKSDGKNWEINAVLESDKYKTTQKKMETDGGNDPAVYEVGSSLELLP